MIDCAFIRPDAFPDSMNLTFFPLKSVPKSLTGTSSASRMNSLASRMHRSIVDAFGVVLISFIRFQIILYSRDSRCYHFAYSDVWEVKAIHTFHSLPIPHLRLDS